MSGDRRFDGSEIAVVGLDCRFPGADSPEAFWHNLRDGVESIRPLSEQEILAAGERPERLRAPGYVRRAPVLADVERFDAAFFGYNDLEARLMDPQQRLLLEVSWGALESAGYDPARYEPPVGVFAGSKTNTYLFHLASQPEVLATIDPLQLVLGGDQAMLATRVSYQLGLRGPSYSVQTACSTSLVAVHLACQSLLLDECRMALAGGVCVNVPHRVGYLHQEGGIVSPDGHCRAFDARAAGTVFGSGAGVVVLKRLEDALADGDRVRALILGSATNNDGAGKATFTAPDVAGQTRVIVEALAMAGVDAESISYVEGHGTGTALGDPIEVLALTQAFRASTSRHGFCALGSVKTNLGHLDAAAGMSSLIKTVLALEAEELPPSLHFETPNPRIDFGSSPFRVVDRREPWPRGERPRRAGVSSFGFGGTNAHLILEEAPPPEPSDAGRGRQVLVLSARTEEALEASTDRLADHLERHPEVSLADAAYTLRIGRRDFPHRRFLSAEDRDEAVAVLRSRDPARLVGGREDAVDRPVAFLFPGQGAQYPGMARGLYRAEPAFRRELDRIAELARPLLGAEGERGLLDLVFGADGDPGAGTGDGAAAAELRHTAVAQVAVFAVEVALARALEAWGVRPRVVAGHSLGEYSAACVAGVFSLEDGLRLVAARGRLMGDLPGGAMLSVDLPPERVNELLEEHGAADLSLAAVNTPGSCVVSGPEGAVAAFEGRLDGLGDEVGRRRLQTSHAFHSVLMEPALEPFAAAVAEVSLSPPAVPLLTNRTGSRAAEEVTRPEHWARHLRETVRFSDCLATLFQEPDTVLLEVGPGTTLGTLALRHPGRDPRQPVISTLRHPGDRRSDPEVLLDALGRLWLAGARMDPAGYWAGEARRRVPLPTYPFGGERHWIAAQAPGSSPSPGDPSAAAVVRRDDPAEWLYRPEWEAAGEAIDQEGGDQAADRGPWLLLSDGSALAEGLARRLRDRGGAVTEAVPGDVFAGLGEARFQVPPGDADAWGSLLEAATEGGAPPAPLRVVHLWDLDPEAPPERRVDLGFHAWIALGRALSRRPELPVCLDRISAGLHAVAEGEVPDPLAALSAGPCLVLPQELPQVVARGIDLPAGAAAGGEAPVEALVRELSRWPDGPEVALREGRRWHRLWLPAASVDGPGSAGRLRQGGVYLVFGGFGRLGSAVAEHLARRAGARLVLAGRSPLRPDGEGDGNGDDGDRRLALVTRLEALGAEVAPVQADLLDAASVAAAVAAARRRFGALHGVIHAAGVAGGPTFRPAAELGREDAELHFSTRVHGLRNLAQALTESGAEGGAAPEVAGDLDFVLLNASLSSLLGGLGNCAYAAASRFMDAFAEAQRGGGVPWIAVDWDAWAEPESAEGAGGVGATLVDLAVRPEEASALLDRVLAPGAPPHLAVSTGDLHRRVEQWVSTGAPVAAAVGAGPAEVPEDPAELERRVLGLWKRVLARDDVGLDDNFFDLGGNSLNGMQLLAELGRELGVQLPPVTLFEAPTVSALVRRLLPDRPARAPAQEPTPPAPAARSGELAIVGMACRLPGAASPDELWENVRAGRESIRRFDDEELRAAGVDPELLADPSYVKARPVLEGADLFDAGLFGVSPREAELMDPQQRVFLEVCWQALCHAGRDPGRHPGRIGVFGGASLGTYLLGLAADPSLLTGLDPLQAIIANDKDSLTTLVSYKLGLSGPSVAVQTYCSTSLVAVHLARRSLLDGECDLALAGGVSIAVPQGGYLYRDGSILAPDGRCRPFDAAAGGTLFGDGAGVVVLKRLEDALADGDTVHAVIKGTAVNNDGSLKAGFTAPSVEGQAEVVRAALADAGVAPETIGYVEAHGTGTPLGDPIEVAALDRAFAAASAEGNGHGGTRRCALGSLKGNVGHLDRAAGVAGLIKTVLALRHRELPPSLHFETPNPKIDFEGTPFYVNARPKPWPEGDGPRRAGVSALGFGGTNAHVVVEEAPPEEPSGPGRTWQLLVLSAHTPAALDGSAQTLAPFLADAPDELLPDAAYTLQVGRPLHAHRRAVVCSDGDGAAAALAGGGSAALAGRAPERSPEVVFLFPGQGAQRPGAGEELYRVEPVFRDRIDRAAEILAPELGLDLRELLFPPEGESEAAVRRLRETRHAQPALFALETALADLWASWGVRPAAVLGHSVGELAAACVAGVFSFEDGLAVAAARGRLVQELPPGAMLAVALEADELEAHLDGDSLALAAANAPGRSVASGPVEEVAGLEARLSAEGVRHRRLETSHAFHSPMMDPAVPRLADVVAGVELRPPAVPLLSSVTGDRLEAERATDPSYWAEHLRRPVRFRRALESALESALGGGDQTILLEVGPGATLAGLARRTAAGKRPVVVSMPGTAPEGRSLLEGLGRLWVAGVEVDWAGLHRAERRRRVPLPPPALDRARYWLQPSREGARRRAGGRRPDELVYEITWTRAAPPRGGGEGPRSVWLLGDPGNALARALAGHLAESRATVTPLARTGAPGASAPGWVTLDPLRREDWEGLLTAGNGGAPDAVVHLWSVDRDRRPPSVKDPERLARELEAVAGVLDAAAPGGTVDLWVATTGLQEVSGDEDLDPEGAPLVAACRRITRRGGAVVCRLLDLPARGARDGSAAQAVVAELAAPGDEVVAAYRGGRRWVTSLRPVATEDADDRAPGEWLVVGGLEGPGFALARGLAAAGCPRLTVTHPEVLPEASDEIPAETDGSGPPPDGELERIAAESRLSLDAGAEALGALQAEARDRHRPERPEPDVEGAVDALCAAHARSFVAGAFQGDGEELSLDEVATRLEVDPRYEPLLRHLVSMLEADGLAERSDSGRVRLVAAPPGARIVEALERDVVAREPALEPGVAALSHCARHLPEVARGELEAPDVLYPGGDPSMLQGVMAAQERFSWTAALRSVIAALVRSAAEAAGRSPAAPLRVLEAGAGAGQLTWPLLEELADTPVEYHFADGGRSFVLAAQREAARRGFDQLQGAVLDLSRDPEPQGFRPHSYHAVVALDAVHPTPRLGETLGRLRRLLVPGGLLLLVEPIRLQRWVSLIWGLTPEWWSFADHELRPDSPLLGADAWSRLAREEGFETSLVLPLEGRERQEADHGLVVCRQPGGIAGPSHRRALEEEWRARRARTVETLRRVAALEAAGAEVHTAVAAPSAEGWTGLAAAVEGAPAWERGLEGVVFAPSPGPVSVHLAGLRELDRALAGRSAAPRPRGLVVTGAAEAEDDGLGHLATLYGRLPSERRGSLVAWTSVAWGLDIDGERAAGALVRRLLAASAEAGLAVAPDLEPGEPPPWHRVSALRRSAEADSAAAPAGDLHARPELAGEYVEPATDDERAIARVWQEVLGLDRVGAHDDFLELGGDSLIAGQLVARLQDALHLKVPVDRLLARPTVTGLAETVAELRAERDERRRARVLERLSSLSEEEAAVELSRLEAAATGTGGEP